MTDCSWMGAAVEGVSAVPLYDFSDGAMVVN
jgi:hypothetical protein